MAQGAGANDDIDHAALIGGLTTVDDAGVGNETDRTASRELMSAMTVVVSHLRWISAVLD